MLTRFTTRLTGSAAVLVLCAAPVGAQDSRAVVQSAAKHVADWISKDLGATRPVIEIDPRILMRVERGIPRATQQLHPQAVLSDALIDGVSQVVSVERAQMCDGIKQIACRTNGVYIGFTFGAPLVNANAATTEVFVRVSRTPTPADSAKALRARDPQSALRRLNNEAGAASLLRLQLVRQGASWRVVDMTIVGQS